MESVSSCIVLSQILSCLTNSFSVFPLISILSSSSVSLSPGTPFQVFYISVSLFFLRFSISWLTSSLILSIFIFNSLMCLFTVFSVSLWSLFKAPMSSFVSLSSCILFFWCLEIS
jgi:hypothetical protein